MKKINSRYSSSHNPLFITAVIVLIFIPAIIFSGSRVVLKPSSYSSNTQDKSLMEFTDQGTGISVMFHAEIDSVTRNGRDYWKKLEGFAITDFELPLFPVPDTAGASCTLKIQFGYDGPDITREQPFHLFINTRGAGIINPDTLQSLQYVDETLSIEYIQSGENIISIVRNAGQSSEWYVDWIEIMYPGVLVNTFQVGANDAVGDISNNTGVSQTFLSTSDNLSSVHVMFVLGAKKDDQVFQFKLAEEKTPEKIVRGVTLPGMEINSYRWASFNFAPVENSAGKKYIFTITKSESDGNETFTLLRITSDTYPHGQRYINSNPYNDDLRFICYSK